MSKIKNQILHKLLFILAIIRDLKYLAKIVIYNLLKLIDFNKPIIINPNGKLQPIILIHGSGGNQSEWIESIPWLKKYFNLHPIYAFSMDLDFNFINGEQTINNRPPSICYFLKKTKDHMINYYVKKLDKHIKYVIEKHDYGKQVILIGHSMGGLVASELLYDVIDKYKINNKVGDKLDNKVDNRVDKLDNKVDNRVDNKVDNRVDNKVDKLDNKVDKLDNKVDNRVDNKYDYNIMAIVTISSPLQGAPLLNTNIKKILNTRRHKQMTPGSKYLSKFKEKILNTNVPYLSIGSEQDIHVPDSHAKLNDKISHENDINGHTYLSLKDGLNIYNDYDKDDKNMFNRLFRKRYAHSVINGYGHFSIVSSELLWKKIKLWLEDNYELDWKGVL